MATKICSYCQARYIVDNQIEDYIHNCGEQGGVSEVLRNEDIKKIGDWNDSKVISSRATHNEVTSKGTLLEDFEVLSDWTVGGTDATQELSTTAKNGIYSLKINAINGNAAYSTKTISQSFSSVINFIFWCYLEKDTDTGFTGNIAIYFSSTTDWSKYFIITIDDTRLIKGWNRMVVDKSVFTNTGTDSWSNTMVRMRVRINLGTDESCYVCFDDLRYDYNARPKIIICFDDEWQSVYDNAFPIMKANNQKGVLFIITDNVGTTDRMSLTTINELYRSYGWNVCSHTKSHQYLTTISETDMHTEIDSADIYLTNYTSKKFIAYPYGYYNDAVISYVKSKNIVFGRTIVSAQYQPHINLSDDLQYKIKCVTITNTTATATIQGYIDQLINQKGLLILLFHKIEDTTADDSTEYLTADFQTVSNYIKTQVDANLLDVETFTEYYADYTDITGNYGIVQQSNLQGITNNIWGTRGAIEGDKVSTLTSRGNDADIFRTRKHSEFINLKGGEK